MTDKHFLIFLSQFFYNKTLLNMTSWQFVSEWIKFGRAKSVQWANSFAMIISKDLFLLGDQDYLRLPNKDEKRTTMIRPAVKSQRYVVCSLFHFLIVLLLTKLNIILYLSGISCPWPNLESCFKTACIHVTQLLTRYYFI